MCAAMATEHGYDTDTWHRMAEELGLLLGHPMVSVS